MRYENLRFQKNRHILTSECLSVKIFGVLTEHHEKNLLAKFHFLSGRPFKWFGKWRYVLVEGKTNYPIQTKANLRFTACIQSYRYAIEACTQQKVEPDPG